MDHGEMEPFYSDVDTLTNRWKNGLSPGQFKFFDACRFKLKAIWEINDKIKDLDAKYIDYLKGLALKQDFSSDYFYGDVNDPDCLYYFPFFEALEFENLLSQAKAFLDCFSKAIGSLYEPGSPPNNVKNLINVLTRNQSTASATQILPIIESAKTKLNGIVIDPSSRTQKSLRDLISHRERADIRFVLRKENNRFELTSTNGCLLNWQNPAVPRLATPNTLITAISQREVWYCCLEMLQKCFEIELRSRNL